MARAQVVALEYFGGYRVDAQTPAPTAGCDFLLLTGPRRRRRRRWRLVARERRCAATTKSPPSTDRAGPAGRTAPVAADAASTASPDRHRPAARTRGAGKHEPEDRALARLAVDVELAAVALHDVLDDRQPEPGAAGLARAAAVDAIEALGQARQVLARDARAACRATANSPPPSPSTRQRDVDPAAVGRVADGVVDEVARSRSAARSARRRSRRRRRPRTSACAARPTAPARRPRPAPAAAPASTQRSAGGPRAALELRQRQQIADQRLHALVCCAISASTRLRSTSVSGRFVQRLDEARQHRQRRADLVRDVGDEVAPHASARSRSVMSCDSTQLHAVAVGPHQHRQRAAAARRLERHRRSSKSPRLQVGHEGRRAHQVGDALAPVALRVEAEVVGRASSCTTRSGPVASSSSTPFGDASMADRNCVSRVRSCCRSLLGARSARSMR